MKLSELGEFEFIERFAHRFQKLLSPRSMGIGDDCAIIPCNENHDLVVTTDMLVEDIHFILNKISPEDLGYKALAVNLSDVAAMGAKPAGTFFSLAVPEDIKLEYLDSFMDGYYKLSESLHLPLWGGDTTRSTSKIILNISVIGKVEKGKAKLRSSAKTGDIIAVTNKLGNSAAGLQIIRENYPLNKRNQFLVNQHNRPDVQIDEGIWLGKQKDVNAMMDVSDGIASDLFHILKASGKGAEINLNLLPLSNSLTSFCNQYKINALDLATSGGEDYCLLLTVNPAQFDTIANKFKTKFNKELYKIGTINNNKKHITWLLNGKETDKPKGGFNHFI